jgi:hypothetical protein
MTNYSRKPLTNRFSLHMDVRKRIVLVNKQFLDQTQLQGKCFFGYPLILSQCQQLFQLHAQLRNGDRK